MPNRPLRFSLRRARASDHGFAERLYLASMAPRLSAFSVWNEAEALARFRQHFRLRQTRIITANSTDLGFFQVVVEPHALELRQLHLLPAYRNQGIGSALIRRLQRRAARHRRRLWLTVVQGNPAIELYGNLGFIKTGEEEFRDRMEWLPPGD